MFRTILMLMAVLILTGIAFGQARPIQVYLIDEKADVKTAGHEVFNGLSARIRASSRFNVLTTLSDVASAQVLVHVNCAEKPFEKFCSVQVSFQETSSGLTEDLTSFLAYGGTTEDAAEHAFQGFKDATTDDKIAEMRERIRGKVEAYCSDFANHSECQGYTRN